MPSRPALIRGKLEAERTAMLTVKFLSWLIKKNPFKTESEKRINILQGKETSNIVILQQNMTFLQNELLSKIEIIKSLMEIVVCFSYNANKLFYVSKLQLNQSQLLHHSQPQFKQRGTYPHIKRNLLATQSKIVKH